MKYNVQKTPLYGGIVAGIGSLALLIGAFGPGPIQSLKSQTVQADPARVLSAAETNAAIMKPQERITAIILFNFKNDPSQPMTPQEASRDAFTSVSSVAAYYKEISGGRLQFIGRQSAGGDVLGWVTIPFSNQNCLGNHIQWGRAAEAQLGFDATKLYDNVVYVFPFAQGCQSTAWSEQGTIGTLDSPTGSAIHSWIQATAPGAGFQHLVAHELGHTFGLLHAPGYVCPGVSDFTSISFDDTACTIQDTGDAFDVMGSGRPLRYLSNFNLARLDWLPQSTIQDITTSGTYQIFPLETPKNNVPKSLRIPRINEDGNPNGYLYLEFRRPSGAFDNFQPTDPAVNGISIRTAPDFRDSSPSARAALIDTTPGSGLGFADAPLLTGRTLVDSKYGISITTQSVGKFATVSINIENLAVCRHRPPQISVDPDVIDSATPTAQPYNAIITNTDNQFCTEPTTYTWTSTMPGAGWSQNPPGGQVTLTPGDSTSMPITIAPPPDIANGNYLFTEQLQSPNIAGQVSGEGHYNFIGTPLSAPPKKY